MDHKEKALEFSTNNEVKDISHIVENPGNDSDSDSENKKGREKKGRRKIKIEFIDDKSKRHITFSKRKAGIMKKAYELATLTGTQVLLLVASETGHVYTFATPKLQPLITKPEGKQLIQTCLNAPEPLSSSPQPQLVPPQVQPTPLPPQLPFPTANLPPPNARLPYADGLGGPYEDPKTDPALVTPYNLPPNYTQRTNYAQFVPNPLGTVPYPTAPPNYLPPHYPYGNPSQS